MQSTTPNKALMEQARVALRGKLGKVSCQNKNYYSVDDFSKVEKIDSHYHIYTENNSSVEQAQKDNFKLLIVFGLTGTGYFDMVAYGKYNDGAMSDVIPTDDDIRRGLAGLPKAP